MTGAAPHVDALAGIAADIRDAVSRTARPDPLVLIDGRSGAGKSTLAWMLRREGDDLLALEDIYPGWDGLAAASRILVRDVLTPRASGRVGRWHRWDWERDAPAEAHEVAPGRPLIVEGVGAITPGSAALADVTVWLDAPVDLRRARALARDGDAYAPHWERWAAQEEQHLAAHDPRSLADRVYDVAAASSIARTSPSSR